jgi:hypothetical protein
MLVGTVLFLMIFAGLYFGIRGIRGSNLSSRARGSRLVTCPEIKKLAVVAVAAGAMVVEGFPVLDRLRIGECSRWPMRRDCGQDCLGQIEARPTN